MIYVKVWTRILLILLCSGGIIASSLLGAAHSYSVTNYGDLTAAMKAGDEKKVNSIVQENPQAPLALDQSDSSLFGGKPLYIRLLAQYKTPIGRVIKNTIWKESRPF